MNDIIILRLGKNINYNNNLIYSKDKVYILFNMIDISETIYYGPDKQYIIKRATTEANVKALFYLMNEYKNFFQKEIYNNIILVSNQGSAERQLEAFNIVSNIFKYGFEFNSVIWNRKYENTLNDKNISDILIEIVVKSYNLIANSLRQMNLNEFIKNKNKNLEIINLFIEEMFSFTNKLK